MILWWASLNGPMALPGKYKVELTVNDTKETQGFNILRNPVSVETAPQNSTAKKVTYKINIKNYGN